MPIGAKPGNCELDVSLHVKCKAWKSDNIHVILWIVLNQPSLKLNTDLTPNPPPTPPPPSPPPPPPTPPPPPHPVPHICVGELGQHWFRQWYVLNQCCIIINYLQEQTSVRFESNTNLFVDGNVLEKSSVKWRPFFRGGGGGRDESTKSSMNLRQNYALRTTMGVFVYPCPINLTTYQLLNLLNMSVKLATSISWNRRQIVWDTIVLIKALLVSRNHVSYHKMNHKYIPYIIY